MKTILEAFFMAFALATMLVVALTIACIAVVVPVLAFINGGFVAAFFSLIGVFFIAILTGMTLENGYDKFKEWRLKL